MTDDLQEIDGVGPAREENLIEAGYETYQDLAEADHEELTETIQRLPEDSALELVVQAQNLVDLEDAEVSSGDGLTDDEEEVSDEEEVKEESQDDVEDVESEDVDADAGEDANTESQSASETHYSVELDFDGVHEYDTFYHTLIEERCNLRRTNRDGVESYEKMLESMRDIAVDGEFTVELTEDELNDLHNAVLEQRIDYQGENLIDYMDALRAVENNVNAVREEFLF